MWWRALLVRLSVPRDLSQVAEPKLERLRARLQRAHDAVGGEIVRRCVLEEP